MRKKIISTKILNRLSPKKFASSSELSSLQVNNVTSSIYDAALAIANAVKELVQAAEKVQQERVSYRLTNPNVYRRDPMWANGLISAAKTVAMTTEQIVRTAQAMVISIGNSTAEHKNQQCPSEEELVTIAKAIATSTSQLVAASRAKTIPGTLNVHQNLSKSARAVAMATSELVTVARQFTSLLDDEEERQQQEEALDTGGESSANSNNNGKTGIKTGSVVRHLEQQMKILRLEKELEKARRAMFDQRKKEYQSK